MTQTSKNIQFGNSGLRVSLYILYYRTDVEVSGSVQKLIFDHDRLIGFQKSIFQSDHRFLILYDRSFHFPMIDFSNFFFTMKKTDFMALQAP